MTHHDSGHFSAKHPNGTNVPPALQQAVSDQIVDKANWACSATAPK
ncbi:MAG: hypothetical protein HZB87_08225 [Desulfatitalea sp.]|nr:hypothetical protein [Desulfatitalea sp.]